MDYKLLNKTLKEGNRKLRQENNKLACYVAILKAKVKELETEK